MKKIIVVVVGLSCLFGNCYGFEPTWQEISRGIVSVKAVLVDQDNSKVIYAAGEKGIFKTEDAGNTWRNIFSLRGANHTVNYLAFSQQDKKNIYAATGNGLFFSANQGQRWERIFKGKNAFENDCVTLAILPYGIYLGTKSGLFISKDNGRSWHKESGKLGKSRIFNLAYSYKEPGILYVACLDGVFKSSDSGKSWERIFAVHPAENGLEAEEEAEDRDEEERYSKIRYITIHPDNQDYLYLATTQGVYASKDKGLSWELLAEYGLLSRDTQFLLFSSRFGLYAVTKSGVFVYNNDVWQELSFALSAGKINFLGLDRENNLYACADKGLFKMSPDINAEFLKVDIITQYTQGEPEIKEVQQEAIKYAEVDAEKIRNWRKQAAKKAVMPKVSLGLDRNATDLWHWESGSTTRADDDTLRRGRDNLDWDVSLSWDLGDLIWNDDQTSIDVRSRLLVQLRGDILDEVNKIYFERIRVKMEMDNLTIEDRRKRFEKELRIKELTASLDGLTGGYFSSYIQANKR